MASPYYTVYSSLMTFKISDIRTIDESSRSRGRCNWNQVKAYLMILPTMLVIMLVFDVLAMMVNCVVYVGMLIAMLTPFRLKAYEMNEQLQS